MPKPLRVLIVEDSEDDAQNLLLELRRGGYEPIFERVDTKKGMNSALNRESWDIVLSDYSMPKFNGLDALKIIKERELNTPFILISGTIGEELAVNAMKAGANDYLMKDNLKRLVPAIERELKEAQIRLERKQAEILFRKTQTKLQNLIETIPAVVYIAKLDEVRSTEYVSPQIKNLLGFSAEEWLADPELWYKQIHPEDRSRVMQEFFQSYITQEPQRKEYRIKSKSGYFIWVRDESIIIEGEIGEANFSQGVIIDITECKKAEVELKESYNKIQKILEAIVQTLSSAIEKREPYTAGHQRRVTQLAISICKELGLPEEKIKEIQIGGLLHDLGKIAIPSEFLNRSGKLTKVELSVIRTHPLVGYDIIKDIEFPITIGQILLQHHERLDGSGYPNRLKNEEIAIEARILGVADVVEAMSSHRPYRPAFGIQKALEEISHYKGILYDPDVVEVCIKVFTEKDFHFVDAVGV